MKGKRVGRSKEEKVELEQKKSRRCSGGAETRDEEIERKAVQRGSRRRRGRSGVASK